MARSGEDPQSSGAPSGSPGRFSRFSRSGPGKWLFRLSVPLFLLSLVYYILMQPSNVEYLVRTLVEGNSDAKIELNVERASLVYGFDIRDIKLSDSVSGRPLVTAERLRLAWFLPSVLIGRVGLRTLHLQAPHLYLTKMDGRWNWAAFSSGEGSEPPPDEDDTPLPEAVNLFFRFQVYANVYIERFALTMHTVDAESGDEFRLNVDNVNLRVAAITRSFREIPLSLDVLDVFDTLLIALNPYQPVNLKLKGADRSIDGRLRLTYFLFRETGEGVTEFASRLVADTSEVSLRRGGSAARRVPLSIYYDTAYDAASDRLLIPIFQVQHANDRWLTVTAEVNNAASPDAGSARSLRLDVARSSINLEPVGRLIAAITGAAKPFIEGEATIQELQLFGSLERLSLKGDIEAQRVIIAPGSGIETLRDFKVDLAALVDLYQVLPFVDPPADYVPDKDLVYGIFYRLLMPELRVLYGATRLRGDAALAPAEGVTANLKLTGLDLDTLVPEILRGRVDADIKLRSPENFRRLGFDGVVRLNNGRYFIGRSRSGLHRLTLDADGALLFEDDLTIDVRDLKLDGRNQAGERLANLFADGNIRFGDDHVYDVNVKSLDVDYENLHAVFPGSLQYTMAPYKTYLSKGVSLKSPFELRFGDGFTSIKVRRGTNLAIPYLRLQDLDAEADVFLGEREIRIQPARLRGLRGALFADADFTLTKSGEGEDAKWTPLADVDLRVVRDSMFRVHENVSMQGSLKLAMNVAKNAAKGSIDVEGLSLVYNDGPCAVANPGPDCYRLSVKDLNLDLPFEHDLDPKELLRLSDNAGRSYQNTYGRTSEPNLTVRGLSSSHSPRGEFFGHEPVYRFYYAGTPAAEGEPGLAARVDYRNNILLIEWLRMLTHKRIVPEQGGAPRWEPGGTVDGRGLFFNLADLEQKNMEAGLNLQVQRLDLEPYLPGRNRYKGEISGDLRWTTRSLEDYLYSTDALLSIHQIEQDFSGFVTRILLPTQVAALLVNNTLAIPSIRVELKGGLVYSYVRVRRGGAIGILVKPGGEEIKQERMPIAQFLERARSEFREGSEVEAVE